MTGAGKRERHRAAPYKGNEQTGTRTMTATIPFWARGPDSRQGGKGPKQEHALEAHRCFPRNSKQNAFQPEFLARAAPARGLFSFDPQNGIGIEKKTAKKDI